MVAKTFTQFGHLLRQQIAQTGTKSASFNVKPVAQPPKNVSTAPKQV